MSELHEGDFVYVRPQGNEKSWGKDCCPRTSRFEQTILGQKKENIAETTTFESYMYQRSLARDQYQEC